MVVTAYMQDGQGSVPGRSKNISLCQHDLTSSGVHSAYYPISTSGSLTGSKVAEAHLHLVPRLRIHVFLPPLPINAFTA